MKKFWIGLIGLVFISGLVFAQVPMEKPANKGLNATRTILLYQIGVIEEFVQVIGEKTVMGKSDLEKLQKMVDSFFELKKRLFKEIDSIFPVFTKNDSLEVAFIYECQKAVIEYLDGIFWYGDDNAQTIKKFFAKYTGKEIEIERAKNWSGRIFVGILAGLALMLLFFFYIDRGDILFFVGVIVFTCSILVCLFVL